MKKRGFLILLVLTAASALSLFLNREAEAQCRVLRHDLRIRIEPASQGLVGSDTLTLACEGARRVTLELNPGATVHSVEHEGVTVPFEFKGGILEVGLSGRGDHRERTLTIRYEALFRDPVPQDPVNTEDPSHGVSGVISPQGVMLLAGARWVPDIPESRGKVRLQVDVPEGFEAVTAGRLTGRRNDGARTLFVWEIDHPLRGLSLSAGPYVVIEGHAGEIPTALYRFRQNDAPGKSYLDAVSRYIALYQDLFGPYPFPKFAVVENFLPTGYGFASYTLLGSRVMRLPFIVETSLGHEVAHSWWGNGVFVDYRKGNWSEGLTTYVADHLFKERSSEEEGREYRRQMLRNYSNLVSPEEDFPLGDFMGRESPASRAVGYGKGAMVFHMVRRLAGDDAFWKGLREVYRSKVFKEANWDDFASALALNSKEDFHAFFRQWVLRPGAPVIRLEDVRAEKSETGWRVHGAITQQGPLYRLHVPVRLESGKEFTDTTVEVKEPRVLFVIETKHLPGRLVVDPRVDVFRRLHPGEIPPDVNTIKGSNSLTAIMADGAEGILGDSPRTLLQSLGHGGVPIKAEKDIDPSKLKGRDILLFGFPSARELLPSTPEGFSIAREHFVLDGAEYRAKGDAAFVVLPSPVDGERAMGIFLPLSDGAAGVAARKVTHYGTSSALIFQDGTMRAKKVWPPAHSPLIHNFAWKE